MSPHVFDIDGVPHRIVGVRRKADTPRGVVQLNLLQKRVGQLPVWATVDTEPVPDEALDLLLREGHTGTWVSRLPAAGFAP